MSDFDGIIQPSPEWVDIPSLSTTAIAKGGTAGSGVMNTQATALTKRTNYLYNYSVKVNPSSGFIGIGISNPIDTLQINQTTPAILLTKNSLPIINDVIGSLKFGSSSEVSSSAKAKISASAETNWTNGTSAATKLTLSTTPSGSINPVDYVTLAGNGNFGIGSDALNPTANLEIRKNQNSDTTLKISNLNIGASTRSKIDINTGTSNSTVSSIVSDNNGSPYYQLIASAAIQSAYYDMPVHVWRNTAGIEKMRLDPTTGRLGLGVVPSTTLDVKSPLNFDSVLTLRTTSPTTNSYTSFEINNIAYASVGVPGLANQIGNGSRIGDLVLRANNFGSNILLSTQAGFSVVDGYGRIGINTSPNLSLDISGNDGIRVPSGSIAQRPVTPSVGTIRHNTENLHLEAYTADSWVSMTDNRFPFRNRIRNGDMNIMSRVFAPNTVSATGIAKYSLDGWVVDTVGSGALTVSRQSNLSSAPGFTSSLKAIVSTASSSIGSTDYYVLEQRIEGLDLQDFLFGSSSAVNVALSFWVQSSVAGRYSVILRGANNMSYVVTYDITSANTWQQVKLSIPGSQIGSWIYSSTTIGLRLTFSLGAGSLLQIPSNTWRTNNYLSSTDSSNAFMLTANNVFQITGVQLEPGYNVSPFEYIGISANILRNERYYEYGQYVWRGYATSGVLFGGSVKFCVPKRSVSVNITTSDASNTGFPSGSVVITGTSIPSEGFDLGKIANATQAAAYSVYWFASAEL
jgi:hypothetical protein